MPSTSTCVPARSTRSSARTGPARAPWRRCCAACTGPTRAMSNATATRIRLRSPRDGLAHGIGMVHQHFRLVDRFTVAENVVLGDPDQARMLDRRDIEQRVADIGERFGLPIDPRRADLQPHRRPATAGRDRQDALPRRRRAAARRADRRAHATRGRGAVHHRAFDDGRGQGDRLHQPQARRGDGDQRPRHRDARWRRHRRGRHRRHQSTPPRRADGRAPGRDRHPARQRHHLRRRPQRLRVSRSTTATRLWSTTSTSRSTAARSSASPASPATASAHSPARSPV